MPAQTPIGLQLTRGAKEISAAFNDALAEAGGSLPVWVVLISLKTRRLGNQRELARAVGIRGATLTHHLNAMERDGLVTRRRAPDNRRIHLVELTEQGEALFHRLRAAAVAFDRRLRTGVSDEELATFASVLGRMHRNVSGVDRPAGPRPGGPE
ncbi:MarR family transcriptional regulator [Gandjariella thermophila]|uniref:MarR family transcriptional regulator n=2 Tax=Gandjariella thermophila TaxID=1931992 RepID=A0A4D4J123_9PSEU|nr:MarR family transcriptional regulator [Gandjariella thermophila]GDY28840.1 MarR family transcriptional regulator [Gandjariella thermophila]